MCMCIIFNVNSFSKNIHHMIAQCIIHRLEVPHRVKTFQSCLFKPITVDDFHQKQTAEMQLQHKLSMSTLVQCYSKKKNKAGTYCAFCFDFPLIHLVYYQNKSLQEIYFSYNLQTFTQSSLYSRTLHLPF